MFQELVELAKEVTNAGLPHDCLYDIVSYVKENNTMPKNELFQQLHIIVENYKKESANDIHMANNS
ncbi:hypothetical protein [Sporomusa acidovorans]|uniref:Uncharacterized protein n=1 Tax=Sporomusa acidovorans (strain ATCC 49682 / DSM 3132 / Mol) TaxID=1123286 RepID=A0ABZ3IZ94_SPOA4|nr:hypothetical protein [Sporomusa acidovorans]OZC16845.1 hypothetical protein SPACI_40650 [Sporomusa acidovorans DSM 3132]SDF24249.1 hypothetical protein SAMN04488499_103927 [Sporomusa acidovorans]